MALMIAADDPQKDDVQAVLHTHLAFARKVTPPEHVHALGTEGLLNSSVTLFSARQNGAILGVGALKHLNEAHAELKSMHTLESARGQGVGRAMVGHLLSVAAARGYHRVSLETGTQPAFAAARRLYQEAGFTPCEPFGDYTVNPWSTCMTLRINGLRLCLLFVLFRDHDGAYRARGPAARRARRPRPGRTPRRPSGSQDCCARWPRTGRPSSWSSTT